MTSNPRLISEIWKRDLLQHRGSAPALYSIAQAVISAYLELLAEIERVRPWIEEIYDPKEGEWINERLDALLGDDDSWKG